jgi:hypothetical protein
VTRPTVKHLSALCVRTQAQLTQHHASSSFVLAAIVATVASFGLSSSAGAATPAPRLLTTDFEHTFQVHPKKMILDSADGGELVIRWQAWTAQSANGTGTSYPDHGQYPIKVSAAYPVNGEFQVLRIEVKVNSTWRKEPELHLACSVEDPNSFQWASASWTENPESGLRAAAE